MRMAAVIFQCLMVCCSPYRTNEFTSCAAYEVEPFSHRFAGINFYLPAGWETEMDFADGDTLSVTATDTDMLRQEGRVRTIGYMQFPTTGGDRDFRTMPRQVLRESGPFLEVERGLIRLRGKALKYHIGNEELYSVILITYQVENQMILILARIERRDQPTLNDFCFIGPVLEKLLQDRINPRV